MSESQEVAVSAYLSGTGQEFSDVFTPSNRQVSSSLLASEILLLEAKAREEIEDAEKNGNRKTVDGLEKVVTEVESLIGEAAQLTDDDVTDRKFQLEDKKRRLAQQMFELTSSKRLDQTKARYIQARDEISQLVAESGNDRERHTVSDVKAREQTFVSSANPDKILAATAELDRVRWQILLRTPRFLVDMFEMLVARRTSMNDQQQVTQCIESGKLAIDKQAWEELRRTNDRLWDLMPANEQASEEMRIYTGIV
jgi:molecular chaperone DnaK